MKRPAIAAGRCVAQKLWIVRAQVACRRRKAGISSSSSSIRALPFRAGRIGGGRPPGGPPRILRYLFVGSPLRSRAILPLRRFVLVPGLWRQMVRLVLRRRLLAATQADLRKTLQQRHALPLERCAQPARPGSRGFRFAQGSAAHRPAACAACGYPRAPAAAAGTAESAPLHVPPRALPPASVRRTRAAAAAAAASLRRSPFPDRRGNRGGRRDGSLAATAPAPARDRNVGVRCGA